MRCGSSCFLILIALIRAERVFGQLTSPITLVGHKERRNTTQDRLRHKENKARY